MIPINAGNLAFNSHLKAELIEEMESIDPVMFIGVCTDLQVKLSKGKAQCLSTDEINLAHTLVAIAIGDLVCTFNERETEREAKA